MSPTLYDVKTIEHMIYVTYQWVVKIAMWHQNKDTIVCFHPQIHLKNEWKACVMH